MEKDALEWSRERLTELLVGVPLATGDVAVATTALLACTGEAYVNRRKGKIIPGYEVTLKLAWEGTCPAGAAKGTVRRGGARSCVHGMHTHNNAR